MLQKVIVPCLENHWSKFSEVTSSGSPSTLTDTLMCLCRLKEDDLPARCGLPSADAMVVAVFAQRFFWKVLLENVKENETEFSCSHITQIAATRSFFLIQAQATWMSLRNEQRAERLKQRRESWARGKRQG